MSKRTKSDEGRGASVEGQEKTRPDNSEPGTFIGGFMPESPAVKRLCRLAEVAAEVERGLVNLGEMIDGQGGMAIVALTHQVHDHPAVAHARGTAEVWKAVAYNPDEEAK